MSKFDVELLPAAFDDLDHIFDYILMDDPSAAEGVLNKIMTSLGTLEEFPYAGVKLIVQSLAHYDFRMIIIDSYIAFYRFVDGKVYIYRILHGAMDYVRILKRTDRI